MVQPSSQPKSAMAPEVRHLVVDEESDGQRLDNFLLRVLKGVPKTHVYRIIRSGEVRIDKGRAQADTRLQTGQTLRLPPIRVAENQTQGTTAAPAPRRGFNILHENERWLAIDKPAGVAVHGGSGVAFGVIEQLRAARPEAKFLELVHRLDRDTSGVLLIAKRRSALVALQDQFRDRSIQKTYLAMVLGDWPAPVRRIQKPLHKYLNAEGERRVRIAKPGDADDGEGKSALSLVNVLHRASAAEAGPNWSAALGPDARLTLLQVQIKTGRTHQIRVHLQSHACPIVGDDKYGQFDANKALAKHGIARMLLHAWKLTVGADEAWPETTIDSICPFLANQPTRLA